MNNWMYEWGKNCSTLGLGLAKAERILESWGKQYCIDDEEQFWEGYYSGPREDGMIMPVPSAV